MKVGLYIPCYIDQFYPQVAVATLQLLQRLGCTVHYPVGQTCCGQPLSNSGFHYLAGRCSQRFQELFAGFDHVVCPSASCVLHLREHVQTHNETTMVSELTEFLTDVLQVAHLPAYFPFKVGIHTGCHGQRGLGLASMTESMLPSFSKPEKLLSMVSGIRLSRPARPDECCGFGGSFCVFEESVSVRMGADHIAGHEANAVDFITSTDTSCLMHLEGILKRNNSPIQVRHIAEILNAGSRHANN